MPMCSIRQLPHSMHFRAAMGLSVSEVRGDGALYAEVMLQALSAMINHAMVWPTPKLTGVSTDLSLAWPRLISAC